MTSHIFAPYETCGDSVVLRSMEYVGGKVGFSHGKPLFFFFPLSFYRRASARSIGLPYRGTSLIRNRTPVGGMVGFSHGQP